MHPQLWKDIYFLILIPNKLKPDPWQGERESSGRFPCLFFYYSVEYKLWVMDEYGPLVRILVSRNLFKVFQYAVFIFSQAENIINTRCFCCAGQNDSLILCKMLLIWNLQLSFNFLLSFTSNIKARSHFICSWHWLKDDFQNQRTRRAELFSGLSACNSSMHKCQCISLLIECLNASPWPHLALFLVHSTCS